MQRPITIYTRGACMYCYRAKRLLSSRALVFTEIDASEPDVREELEDRTGSYTVPQIFFGNDHIGGFTELRELDARGVLVARARAEPAADTT